MNTTDLTQQIVKALNDRNIPTPNPLYDYSGLNNNNIYTDHQTVFIKINQGGRPVSSLDRELAINPYIEQAMKALYPTPIPVASGRVATVWEYVQLEPANPFTQTDGARLGTLLTQLHATPLTSLTPLLRGTYTDRLISHLEARRREAVLRNYSPKALQILSELIGLLAQNPEPVKSLVLCHGDLHWGNINKVDGQIQLIDWEAAVLAPKELDYAYLSLKLGSEKYDYIPKPQLNPTWLAYYTQLAKLSEIGYFIRFVSRDHESIAGLETLYANWINVV